MNNYRYHDLVQRFALALYILGGKYTYDFVRLNLICALPCPTTITSLIKQSNLKLNEAEFRFNFLQEHFISKNIKYSFASEDSTAIVKKIVYDTATNSFVGFCTPLNNGIPIPHYFRTESFDQLKEWFDSIQKAGFLNLHMIQPISESIANLSPSILSAYGIDNKFTLYDIARKWVYIFNECSSRHIRIVGYATDCDSRYLSAMRTISGFFSSMPSMKLHEGPEAFRIYPSANWNWFFLRPQQLLLFLQDGVHLATKWRNRILSTTAQLTIGGFRIKMEHLQDLLTSPEEKLEHNLVQTDLNPKDKQNFLSCKKISSKNVLELLKKKKETYATYVYLQLLQYIIAAYIETDTSIEDRLYYSWVIVFVCRMWRISLKYNTSIKRLILSEESSERNKKKHQYFITTQAYHSAELNSHNLLFLIMLVKQHDLPKEALNTFLFSSQPCESTFRNARALSGIYRSAVNFTTLDFLHRCDKLSILNEIKYSQGWNENDQIIQFPVHHRKKKINRDISSNSNDINTINIENIILAAFDHAKQLISNLDISTLLIKYDAFELNGLSSKTRASIRLNVNSNDYFLNDFDSLLNSECEYESDSEDELIETNEINDVLLVNDEDQDVIITPGPDELKTTRLTFEGLRIFDKINPILKNSYFRVQINGKVKYIHKQTCCWMLTDKTSRLSADRLSRIIKASKED
ncbi:unnamed protein product [Adineta steineri]|uniref:Uncharacterized protein n=1 Tax=Adineta steineri TaxID=433720 RepID=A0A819P4N8_9BILA|nr:unnamed protein product [Adineta steineri]CAF4006879.1 unnamed protein product [Adineta steineri]